MMQNFQPVDVERYKNTVYDKHKSSKEEIFWNSFKIKENSDYQSHSAITYIDICKKAPFDFATTTGTVVKVFEGENGNLKRTLTKFKTKAYSGKFRADGKVLFAGEDRGRAKIFDVSKGILLRDFKKHKEAVKSVCWLDNESENLTKAVSSSDDNTSMCWDISVGKRIMHFKSHSDKIRSSINFMKGFVTGSYDGTAKLFDITYRKENISFNHGSPIEVVLKFDEFLLSSSGSSIKIWDFRQPNEPLKILTELHSKSITSMICNNDNTRLLTSSLDGSICINEVENSFLNVDLKTTLRTDKEVLSLGLSPCNEILIIGRLDGLLEYRKRRVIAKTQKLANLELRDLSTTKKKLFLEKETELKLNPFKRPRLKQHDVALKQFKYKTALTIALNGGKAHLVVAVFDELIQRGGLVASLAGRDKYELDQLLKFMSRFITHPKFTLALVPVFNVITNIYFGNPHFISKLIRFKSIVTKEVEELKNLSYAREMLAMSFRCHTV